MFRVVSGVPSRHAARAVFQRCGGPADPSRVFATRADNAQPAASQPSKSDVGDERIDKIRGFMKYERSKAKYRPASSRRNDWAEVATPEEPAMRVRQAARCMDCGVPFCQSNTGCPIGNLIPEFNELVFQNQWKCVSSVLRSSNPPSSLRRVLRQTSMVGSC